QMIRTKTVLDQMKAGPAGSRLSMAFSGAPFVIPQPKSDPAAETTRCRSGEPEATAYNLVDIERCFFQFLGPHVANGAQRVGLHGLGYYFSPFNYFGIGPLVTDRNYLDVLAGGLTIYGGPIPANDRVKNDQLKNF